MIKLNERTFRWLCVAAWVTVIYTTLGAVRPVCEYLKANTPFTMIMNIFMPLLLIVVLGIIVKKIAITLKSTYLLLGLSIILYVISFWILHIPEEEVHLIEYGILGFLVYRAVQLDHPDPRAYAVSFGIAALFGWGDEGIQHVLPNRYYQNQDVLLNAWSAALGLLVTFSVQRETKSHSS